MRRKLTWRDAAFHGFNYAIMLLLCFAILYPVLYVLSRSVMTEAEKAVRAFALIPNTIDFSAYKVILAPTSQVMGAYGTTLLRTVIGTALNLLTSTLFAYAISKRKYPLSRVLTFMMTFTMWFGGGLIPSYLLMRSLGLINSFWVYIVPGLMSAWNTLIMRNFFYGIPESLEESAEIDGANDLQTLFRIILPLSKASLATIGLFYAVGHWNAWFDAMLYMNDSRRWTLQFVLRQIVNAASAKDILQYTTSMDAPPPTQAVRMAAIVVATLPILFVYPFVQKYFVKGVLVGSIKG